MKSDPVNPTAVDTVRDQVDGPRSYCNDVNNVPKSWEKGTISSRVTQPSNKPSSRSIASLNTIDPTVMESVPSSSITTLW